MFTDWVKALGEKEGINFEIKNYNDPQKFIDDANKGLIDIAAAIQEEDYYSILKKKKLTPFMSVKVFEKKEFIYCLYAKKGKDYKNISDLRGKHVLTTKEMSKYFILRKLIGKNPEEMFVLGISPNALSAIYALGLDDTDAVFTADMTLDYFKITNPGPVRKIVPVACTGGIRYLPIFKSSKVSDSLARKFVDFALNIENVAEMKKYIPLMKQVKFSFYTVTEDDYKSFVSLLDEGKKLGWNKDFDNWLKYQKK